MTKRNYFFNLTHIFLLLLISTSLTPISSQSTPLNNLKIAARAIPDMCEFVYRVESDFRIAFVPSESTPPIRAKLNFYFIPFYSDQHLPIFSGHQEFEFNGTLLETKKSVVTMSTNPKYLLEFFYFEIVLHDAAGNSERFPTNEENFYFLDLKSVRDKCYQGGRKQTPWRLFFAQELPFVPENTFLR